MGAQKKVCMQKCSLPCFARNVGNVDPVVTGVHCRNLGVLLAPNCVHRWYTAVVGYRPLPNVKGHWIYFFSQTLAAETGSAVSTLNRRLRTQSCRRNQAPVPVSDVHLFNFSRSVPDTSRQSTARQHLSHLRSINAMQLGGLTGQPQPLSSLQGIPASAMPRTHPCSQPQPSFPSLQLQAPCHSCCYYRRIRSFESVLKLQGIRSQKFGTGARNRQSRAVAFSSLFSSPHFRIRMVIGRTEFISLDLMMMLG
jgi:hypothetical protein